MSKLRASDISLSFGGLKALDSVGIEVEPGEIRGIIGANGAGKTTLLNVVCGIDPPDTAPSGSAGAAGRPCRIGSAEAAGEAPPASEGLRGDAIHHAIRSEAAPHEGRNSMTQASDVSGSVSADAYTAIQNLYARYNWCTDQGDADGYAACFTEDGELSLPGIGLHIQGRENLREFKRQDKARRGDRIRRHWNSGLWLEAADDDTMRGRCYLHGYDGTPGEAPVLNDIGAYDDTIVCQDGEWRFAKRVITMDHSAFRPPAES